MYKHDVLLTGASGQVGRYLLRELLDKGQDVIVVMRRTNVEEAFLELVRKARIDKRHHKFISVVLGDLSDPHFELPVANSILNSAGQTSLGLELPGAYWKDNIMTAIRLARHAGDTMAKFHQLSSVAVAEFRKTVMTESHWPIPDDRQLTYSTSKVMVEMSVTAILPYAQILRIGDVVPPMERIREDIRPTHWLPILFKYGKAGFDFAPPEYSVWLSDVSELAKVTVHLMDHRHNRFHILGHKYTWENFKDYATEKGRKMSHIPKWMSDIILYGPEANMVDQQYTLSQLGKFQWTYLGEQYWTKFAEQSILL